MMTIAVGIEIQKHIENPNYTPNHEYSRTSSVQHIHTQRHARLRILYLFHTLAFNKSVSIPVIKRMSLYPVS